MYSARGSASQTARVEEKEEVVVEEEDLEGARVVARVVAFDSIPIDFCLLS